MWPWGHLAVGYLLYSGSVRLYRRCPPRGGPTLALCLGTQFPDLVDKPLNWWFDVFDGRGAGHSLLTLVPLCLVAYYLARRRGHDAVATGFGIGVFSHLAGDAGFPLLVGRGGVDAPYLLWPLSETPSYPSESLVDHGSRLLLRLRILRYQTPTEVLTSSLALQLLLVPALFCLWVLDGYPGLGTGRRTVARLRGVGPGMAEQD